MVMSLKGQRHWIVGITGASGAPYAITLVKTMLSMGIPIHLVITDAGWRVLHEEEGWNAGRRSEALEEHFGSYSAEYRYYPNQDIGASIASGSYLTQGMVIVPCSMGTLAALAQGLSDNLLERAADVMLKEGRRLIVVPRETPIHAIHLENMLKLSRVGARMIPAMPAFYNRPQSVQEMVSFIVGKILDSMEIDHDLYKRWRGKNERNRAEDPHQSN